MNPNNLIALFSVVILIVAGLVLGVINQKSQQPQTEALVGLQTETTSPDSEPEPTQRAKAAESDTMGRDVYINEYLTYVFDKPGYNGEKIDSVRACIWSFNTHRAYTGFRKERAAQRGSATERFVFDSAKLAGTLTPYSERGEEYTRELQSTISYNRLTRADQLRLMEGEPIYFH